MKELQKARGLSYALSLKSALLSHPLCRTQDDKAEEAMIQKQKEIENLKVRL